ncbi:transposase [Paenibacillus sediminis]|uniref:Transposase n=1 Tax=Paenibacillus sediminis TaxID=664909 RepID=A0ABS4H7Q0_9BACL|nr:transposase [Paenibacillus sediminis]MBP1938551.1 hypothetical protein [Paenibacillus sediminis]
MSEKKKDEMLPLSREEVEVDGIYTNEWGQEEHLHRGQHFPADPPLGVTEWQLTEFMFDNHHEGLTDERLVAKKDEDKPKPKIDHPRRHLVKGDR